MNSIEIPGSTLHYLAQKWNDEWTGGYIQQMRAAGEDTFIIKIHTKKGNIDVLIALPYVIMEAQRKWESAEEQPALVNATKKILDNARIERVEQLGSDRILKIIGENANIIIELFGEGNIIITNEKDIIQFVHRAKEWKGRTLKMREKYVAPQNEWKSLVEREKTNAKPSGYTLAPEKNKLRLLPMFEKKSEAEDLQIIFGKMEQLIVDAWKKPVVDSKLETQKKALMVNAARQKELLKEWENKIAEQQAAGEWMYEHFGEVQQLLGAVQRGMKAKVPEREMLEEIRKKMPFVKRLDLKTGTVELEPTK